MYQLPQLLTNCCNGRAFVIDVFTADLSHHSCINGLINIKQAINDPSGRPAFPKLEVTVATAHQHHQKDTGRPLGHVHQLPSSSLREWLIFHTEHPCEGMEDQNLKPSKGYSGCKITQTRCRPPPRKLLKEFHVVLLNSGICPLSVRDRMQPQGHGIP